MKKPDTFPLSKNEIRFMFFLALLTCIITTISLIFILNQLPGFSNTIQEKSKNQVHIGFIVIFCMFIGPIIINNIFQFRKEINVSSNSPFIYRSIKTVFFGVSIIISIVFIVSSSGSTLYSIGIDRVTEFEILDLFCYGVIVWVITGFIFVVIDKYVNKIDGFWDTTKDDVYLYLEGQTKFEHIVSALIMPLSIISEEILFRGYLVLYLGNVYDSFLFFGFTSVVLSVFSHLYQGKGRIINNSVFAGVMVIITILTGRILLATTIHLLNNYLVMFTRWRIMNKKELSMN